jgi:hypothetical protein
MHVLCHRPLSRCLNSQFLTASLPDAHPPPWMRLPSYGSTSAAPEFVDLMGLKCGAERHRIRFRTSSPVPEIERVTAFRRCIIVLGSLQNGFSNVCNEQASLGKKSRILNNT